MKVTSTQGNSSITTNGNAVATDNSTIDKSKSDDHSVRNNTITITPTTNPTRAPITPTNPSTNPPTNPSTNPPTNPSTNPPTNPSTNPPTVPSTNTANSSPINDNPTNNPSLMNSSLLFRANTQHTINNNAYNPQSLPSSLRVTHRNRSSVRRAQLEESDDDRPRSRDRNRNRNNNVERIMVPSFNGITNIVDKIDTASIYRVIYRSTRTFPDNIIKQVAEYATGNIIECDRFICDAEILLLLSGNINGCVNNPQIEVHENGYYDMNNTMTVFCSKCITKTIKCGLNLKPFSFNNRRNNNNNNNNFFGNNMLAPPPFKTIQCSKQFWINGNKYCSDCMAGRRIKIGRVNIYVQGGVNFQMYVYNNESHKYFHNGSTSHSWNGGNSNTNIRYNNNFFGGRF